MTHDATANSAALDEAAPAGALPMGTAEDGGRRVALPGHGSFIGTIET